MTVEEVKAIAKLIGIGSIEKFESQEALIRTIQLAMGFEDCYKEKVPHTCPKRFKCMWVEDCMKDHENECRPGTGIGSRGEYEAV